ncbi:cytochrome P450 [Streptomyces sp. LX-29]|uniref:cytochrome P450 n=1 Tax=Streptomyces sp. LX-29 TaxID=2900152 RepID=UPI00240DE30F|nr:cytochrome P450 [Streptomyces sp. LX-29]WFB11169.1 cytochrome P450 [Streptomyces sp. LX-29]
MDAPTSPRAASERPYDPIDLSSRAFWERTAEERDASYAVLRAERPVSWHPPLEERMFPDPDDSGFWAVVRHEDIVTVSRRHDLFVSGAGVLFENIPEELVDGSQSLLSMDPPRHTRIRRLASGAFTWRQLTRMGQRISSHARRIVDDLAARPDGRAEFVADCAALLPMRVISDVVGIPHDQQEAMAASVAEGLSAAEGTPDGGTPAERIVEGNRALRRMALELAGRRRERPADDLMTSLVQAEIDGERLTDDEIADFFLVLCIAGNDSTTQAIAHGLRLLTALPAQRAWLLADFDARIDTAVEEILRYGTPVMTFRRTAATDTTLGGRDIAAGDKVVMFYASGNRDAAVFPRPDRYDLGRAPNPHLAFGGGGAHFCLAAQLARAQLRVLFRELLGRLPDIEAGEPRFLTGTAIHGVTRLPCRFTPSPQGTA